MLFNSKGFLVFFPIVVILYFLFPKKLKNLWLLAASYYFYMCWNAKYALLLLFSTVITYLSGVELERIKCSNSEVVKKKLYMNLVVIGSFTLNLSVLFYYKYINFACELLQDIFQCVHVNLNIPVFDIILPVGISFFTLQALGYTMDVYRDEIPAEKNFLRYALFVSFFPQLVAGPIERSKNLLMQLREPKQFDYECAREGLFIMLWGFFLKIVLADRIAIFVDTVYNDYSNLGGWYLIVATVLFAVQIYCDFYGYSVIAMGAAKILGIQLMENFHAPYLSLSVAEFWRNWHISLTSWLKDYIYIPLGGSRKGKLRKYINKMIVFMISGLWHGASISFVIWGGLNGFYQIMGEILQPCRTWLMKHMRIHKDYFSSRIVQIIITFLLVDFSWIFFRAQTFLEGISIIRQMFAVKNLWVLFDGSLYTCGLDSKNFNLMIICMTILLFSDYCKKRGILVREIICRQDYWFRWIFLTVSVSAILLFGIWGPGYNAANFIYFQF